MTRRRVLRSVCDAVHIEAALPSELRYKRRICKGIKMLIIQAGCKSCFKPHEICMALCEPYAGRIVALTCHREEQGSFYALLRECGFKPPPPKKKQKKNVQPSPHRIKSQLLNVTSMNKNSLRGLPGTICHLSRGEEKKKKYGDWRSVFLTVAI